MFPKRCLFWLSLQILYFGLVVASGGLDPTIWLIFTFVVRENTGVKPRGPMAVGISTSYTLEHHRMQKQTKTLHLERC